MIEPLRERLGSSVIDVKPLSKGGPSVVWLESSQLKKAAACVRELTEPESAFEFLSAFELNGSIVLTYFFKKTTKHGPLALRVALEMKDADKRIRCESLAELWPAAAAFEQEISELFGIEMTGAVASSAAILPSDWPGYPMRKSYVYPAEYGGIPHLRPVGRTTPDEFGGNG